MESIRTTTILALAVLLSCGKTQAAAPQVRTQAPGFYRMMLGSVEITALLDGMEELQL